MVVSSLFVDTTMSSSIAGLYEAPKVLTVSSAWEEALAANPLQLGQISNTISKADGAYFSKPVLGYCLSTRRCFRGNQSH